MTTATKEESFDKKVLIVDDENKDVEEKGEIVKKIRIVRTRSKKFFNY